MNNLLIASSPVEIEARAEKADLGKEIEQKAIGLFHDLTSDLELLSLDLRQQQGAEWPKHRFYFGRVSGGIAQVLAALQKRSDTMLLQEGSRAVRAPPVLFMHREAGAFAAVLVACSNENVLGLLAAEVERVL